MLLDRFDLRTIHRSQADLRPSDDRVEGLTPAKGSTMNLRAKFGGWLVGV